MRLPNCTSSTPNIRNAAKQKSGSPRSESQRLERPNSNIWNAGELESGTREIYLITDAQESDWGTLSGNSRETLREITRETEFFVLPISTDGEGEENLSISSLNYASGPLQSSGVARFEAND